LFHGRFLGKRDASRTALYEHRLRHYEHDLHKRVRTMPGHWIWIEHINQQTEMKTASPEKRELERGEKDSKEEHELLSESEKLMPELRTLPYLLNKAMEKGYRENYKVTDAGLESIETSRIYQPGDVNVVNFYRFEGITDPADMAVLYVIETTDGNKGTLVDAYGPYSDPKVDQFMKQVRPWNINKV
jgi:hypothetical protein